MTRERERETHVTTVREIDKNRDRGEKRDRDEKRERSDEKEKIEKCKSVTVVFI